MLDTRIVGGTLVDGSGAPARRCDVGLRDGKVVSLTEPGKAPAEPAANTIDAEGLVVAPGFVDPHTHYDAQLAWDPYATPSSLHGVTTVIGGNCGFSLAPLSGPEDAEYIRRMMAVVEGMSLEALETGLAWGWRSFEEWLAGFEGRIAVNAGFLVGHCALRRAVMGDRAVGEVANVAEITAMTELLRESIAGGALGLSSSRSFTHRDGDGQPVPSRAASEAELLALCATTGEHAGTALEFITDGCLNGFSDEEIDLMAQMSIAAGRPLNWNVLTIDSRERERYAAQIAAGHAVAEQGGRVFALTMPILVGMTMSFLTYSPIHQLPDWHTVLRLPLAERMEKLRDAAVRRMLEERAASPDAGVFKRVAQWDSFMIGETYSDANAGLTGRLVKDIAAERGAGVFDTLVDIVLEDDLQTILWPQPPDDDDESWELRREAWHDAYTLLGGSDAGAHLDRMCGAPYPTLFLADCLRGRKLVSLEEAVRMLSDEPARLFGLEGRGRVEVGHHADLVIFDPEAVGAGDVAITNDLPGGGVRLVAASTGMRHVLVAGKTIVRDGEPTGTLPGSILRAGRDTRTVPVPGRPG